MSDKNEGQPVGKVRNGDGKKKAKTGKPRKITSSMMRAKTASFGAIGNGGFMEGIGGNFYSPELSTDFLELPQSLHEQWNYYRYFYRTEPFVGQAIVVEVNQAKGSTRANQAIETGNQFRCPVAMEFEDKTGPDKIELTEVGHIFKQVFFFEPQPVGRVFLFRMANSFR